MGLGKTYLGSEKMNDLGATCNLLICQISKFDDWINHFKEFYPDYEIFNLRSKAQLRDYLAQDNLRIGIINYELTFRRPELLNLNNITMMLDESSYIKNEKAKRTKFILKLKYKNVILLSGTVIGGKYEELYSQCKLLGYKTTKRQFYDNFIVETNIDVGMGFPIPIVVGYKNIDKLKKILAKHGAVFMKTNEVIELPEQIESNITVKNTKQYRDFKKDSYVDMGDKELIGDTTLTKMLFERQLCGIYSKAKQKAFKEHIEGTNARVIVFYNFTKEYEQLRSIAEKLDKPISVVNGKTKDLTNYENEENSITFVQYQAGSKGLNLQKANIMIYYTPTLSAEDYMQSKKRIHRIKQTKTCFYYFMRVENSIEDKIYKALEKGESFTNYLFAK